MPRPAPTGYHAPAVALSLAAALFWAAAATAQDEGPSALSETYRDWNVVCQSPQGTAADGTTVAQRVCEMTQQLTLTETGQRLIAAGIQRDAAGAGAVTLIAPFGLVLAAGLRIEVAGAEPQGMGFLTCLPDGCIARDVLTEATLEALRAGETAIIRMTALSGEDLAPELSLSGFTAAWNRLGTLAAQ